MDVLCTDFLPDLWKDHYSLDYVCGLVVSELVLLDFMSYPCNLISYVAWYARSCRYTSLLPVQYLRVLWRIEASRPPIKISLAA